MTGLDLADWEELRKTIVEICGLSPTWPEHGNAPLAIAALVVIQRNEIAGLTAALKNARAQAELGL